MLHVEHGFLGDGMQGFQLDQVVVDSPMVLLCAGKFSVEAVVDA